MERDTYTFFSHHPEKYPKIRKDGWMFSNFAEIPVIVDGKRYPTSEHYYQAAKFFETDPEWAKQIRHADTAGKAKAMGGSKTHTIDPDWEEKKERVMYRVLRKKARQHPEFKEALLATGDATLIEASPYDSYWGWGKDRQGKNRLGVLLMKLRKRLNQ